jgi:lipoprotein signal peptidase
VIDRLTKLWALQHCLSGADKLNHYVSCNVYFNRGVSWSLFHSDNPYIFYCITGLIIAVTCGVAIYAYLQAKNGFHIFGELLIISGSVANIIDPHYGGVVDFIN